MYMNKTKNVRLNTENLFIVHRIGKCKQKPRRLSKFTPFPELITTNLNLRVALSKDDILSGIFVRLEAVHAVNDSTGQSGSGIACLQTFIVTPATQVVFLQLELSYVKVGNRNYVLTL